MLDHVVEEEDKRVYGGLPDVTLNQLTLTSAFNLVFEAQAGTYGIFRFVPLLVPPNSDIKKDKSHSLRIALKGKKNKAKPGGDNTASKLLTESCRQRLGESSSTFCESEQGQFAEIMIQTLEKNGSTASSGN